MFKVALTGGIGSGKSEAGEIFAKLGAIVIDSDELSRDVIKRGTKGFSEVVECFGDEILRDGEIDRKKLSEVVFTDTNMRKQLERIIHPKVREAFEKIAASVPSNSVLINQIPLLVETNGASNFDAVVTVSTPVAIREKRLLEKGLASHEINKRMATQVDDTQREAIADYIIDNSGDESALQIQVERIFEELRSSASNN